MAIDLTESKTAAPVAPGGGKRYSGLVLLLASALALASGLLIGTVRPHGQPPAPTVTVSVGLSEYPANVTAAWWDQAGHRGTMDPWTGKDVRIAAVRVIIAVAYSDGSVQCTLSINGTVVDTQSANAAGQVAVCEWASTPAP